MENTTMTNSSRRSMRLRVLIPGLGMAAVILVVAALNPIAGVSARSTPTQAKRPDGAAVIKTLAVLHPHIGARAADALIASAQGRLSIFTRARSTSDAMPQELASVLPEAVEQQQSRLAAVEGSNELFVT